MLLSLGSTVRADFPDVSELPARPELPDPLVMLNGDKVSSKEQWTDKRRPELKALFQHYMYGYFPEAPKKVTGVVEREDRKYFGGKATKKEVTITFGPDTWPKIHLLLVIPNARKKPAPVFVGMNFHGNHALVKDSTIPLPDVWMYPNAAGVKDNRATDASRGTEIDVWALEQSIDRGYAVATFYNGDIKPDHREWDDGIHRHLFKEGQKEPGPREWATITAWAWGIMRAVDYLVTDKDLDKTKIAVVGHSRLGKTALLTAAFDERIALAIPLQAGCGGTAPSRGKIGESVTKINTAFPHWFNGEFKKFNDKPERLPFDQNCLAALVAPRPLLFANAVEDTWANPDGQFQVLQAADPAYRLLGAGGLDAKKMPELNQLIDSKLGYYIRPGKHSMTKGDWKVFLDYADKHLGKPETLSVLPLERKTYTDSSGKVLPYRLMLPLNYDPNKKYPLVLFLHGAGERGNDNEKQLVHGVPDFAREENRKRYPCILVAPQCPEGQAWKDWRRKEPQPTEPSESLRLVLELLDSLKKEYGIDGKRIYVTGLSMGGYGTWDLITRHPDKFAAAVPICGGGDPSKVDRIAKLPIWVFHGALDQAVKVERSREMVEALEKAGGKPKYTEYPKEGHASWVPAYKDAAMFEWLFSQKRD